MKRILYYNGIFHSGRSETDTFCAMAVGGGRILATYKEMPAEPFDEAVSLEGQHVYPCLIDGHTHLLFTMSVMAMGFPLCRITASGVQPNTLAGIAQEIRAYAQKQKKNAVIAANNYILTAVDVHRLPTRLELDDWAGGRPMVVYNIDGHSTALSSAMLRLLGIDPEGHSGVMTGEENERIQGRLTDIIAAHMTPGAIARGIARFQNICAGYGIGMVATLEGNSDSPKDITTALILQLARHMDLGVRFYFQYKDIARAKAYSKYQKQLRIGGCGDWEMDGAIGAHSAAFSVPFKDTGEAAPCYYDQQTVNEMVRRADEAGYQISSHAIGDVAIDRLLEALEQTASGRLHRIEHCEFASDKALEILKTGKYALMMQPGYAWIDKRYLHTYTRYLPEEMIARQNFKTFYDMGICLCGSSDSPVQELDPYVQLLGMVQHYCPEESVTPYEAFRCYTQNPARVLGEAENRGTLETGKRADFFTATQDFFRLASEEVVSFRPTATYYAGKPYRQKKGTVAELLASFLKKPQKV